jgi:hypothetical protein
VDDGPHLNVRPFSVLAHGVTTDPVAVAQSAMRVDVVVGVDDGLRHFALAAATARAIDLPQPPSPPTGRSTLGTWGLGRLDLFIRDAGTTLWHCEFDGVWGPWRAARAEGAVSDLSIVSWGHGRFDLFAAAADGVMEHYWYQQPIGLMGPENLAGPIVGQPAALSPSLYGVEVVARGRDDGLLRRQWHVPQERAHVWTSTPMLPGRARFDIGPSVVDGDPALVWCRGEGVVENRLVAYARQNGRLLQSEPRGWRDRVVPGPAPLSDPVAVSMLPCRIDVFCCVESGAIGWLTTEVNAAGESARWRVFDVGAQPIGRPAVCSGQPGRLDLFVRTVDGALRHGWWRDDVGEWNVDG